MFILYHKADLVDFGNVFTYFLFYFLFVMLPGFLAGALASLWIDLTGAARRVGLLSRIFLGIIFYLALLSVVEFTRADLLLFAFGPAATLLIYALSVVRLAR